MLPPARKEIRKMTQSRNVPSRTVQGVSQADSKQRVLVAAVLIVVIPAAVPFVSSIPLYITGSSATIALVGNTNVTILKRLVAVLMCIVGLATVSLSIARFVVVVVVSGLRLVIVLGFVVRMIITVRLVVIVVV